MFDWFWEFLYGISKSIFKIVDGIMKCANMLCGIESMTVDGEETDLLTYLMGSSEAKLGFSVACIVGFILVFCFTAFAVVRAIVKEKPDETPLRVALKSCKYILMFLLVPFIMTTLTWGLNTIMQGMYTATMGGSVDGIGRFLASAFTNNDYATKQILAGADWKSNGTMWSLMDLSDYDFFFSWIAGIAVLFELAKSILMFVDRAFSIVILYIVAPFSISASVLDDGSHFKLWRDSVLTKYLIGYGTIIGMNVYIMVVGLISRDTVVFFQDSTLNNILKLAIILGGAVSLERLMGLIGNLVSSGAGTQEMQQAAMAARSAGGLAKRAVGTALGAATTATGLSLLGSTISGAWGEKKKELSNRLYNATLAKKKPEDTTQKSMANDIHSLAEHFTGGGNAENAIKGSKDGGSNSNGQETPNQGSGGGNANNNGNNMAGRDEVSQAISGGNNIRPVPTVPMGEE